MAARVSGIAPDDAESLSFAGTYRATPKKTRLTGVTIETLDSIEALCQTLVSDAAMRKRCKKPSIGRYSAKQAWKDKYEKRLSEEMRLVQVSCNLYAYRLENGEHGDNDFHLIAGDDEDPSVLLNVEVTGIPENADSDALKQVRHDFLAITNNHDHHRIGTYQVFDNPVPVRIVGSLYFDGDHAASSIGPTGYRPSTVWEVHPVQAIGEP